MARVGRLAGAILAETEGVYYLVGNPKLPCDWRAAGFEPPGELDARVRPAVRLARLATQPGAPGTGAPPLGVPQLSLEVEGEALARLLAETLVIPRTGSVSERLWRLVIGEPSDDSVGGSADDSAGDSPGDSADDSAGGSAGDSPGDSAGDSPVNSAGRRPLPAVVPARWLAELPPAIWNIVRDTVLRCT
jgi:hypothetical protein